MECLGKRRQNSAGTMLTNKFGGVVRFERAAQIIFRGTTGDFGVCFPSHFTATI